ncbi:TPA: hypothetical protein N0F65_003997 [Lagenidium giganteum]|uniref:AB hydrolase-1 domain-containing protein n=1 Tax=Lagenidium giganteum TaxID=4803 RepID=A0AAV2YZV6_9STRA|nr:TPA: hypothetical protein N0F65_003997 [Lagenidium giganteum]
MARLRFAASLVTAVAASATAAAAAAASQHSSPWRPCSARANPDTNDLECAVIEVPLCHQGVCQSDQTIQLFAQRLLAKQDANTKPNVWLLTGGPGMASHFASDMIKLRALSNDNVNLYTTDHRGTGRSARLDCGKVVTHSGYGDCIEKLLAQFDNKAEAFSVTSAAKDVVHLITTFSSKSGTYIYGVSYGTYLTQRVMHLAPKVVRGYILDGVSADRGHPFTFQADDMLPVGKRMSEACESDTFCRSKFSKEIAKHGSLHQAFLEIVNGFDTAPNRWVDLLVEAQNKKKEALGSIGVMKTDKVSATIVVKQFLSDFTSGDKRVLIPAYLYRINRCNNDDVAFLQAFHNSEFSSESELSDDEESSKEDTNEDNYEDTDDTDDAEDAEEPSPVAGRLNVNATKSFLWPDQTSFVQNYCLVTGRHNEPACQDAAMDDIKHYYRSTPAFVYKPDEYSEKVATVPKRVGVLVFNGGLDFSTPWEFGRRQFEDFKTSNKLMVEVKHGAHGNVLTPMTPEDYTECGSRILLSSVGYKGNARKVDTSCLKDVPDIQFNNETTAASLLGLGLQGDAFEGTVLPFSK